MNLTHTQQSSIKVVVLWLLGVQQRHLEHSSWDLKDLAAEEIAGELLSLQCSRGDD